MENAWVRWLQSQYVKGEIEAEELDEKLGDALLYDEGGMALPADAWDFVAARSLTDKPGAVFYNPRVRSNKAR